MKILCKIDSYYYVMIDTVYYYGMIDAVYYYGMIDAFYYYVTTDAVYWEHSAKLYSTQIYQGTAERIRRNSPFCELTVKY